MYYLWPWSNKHAYDKLSKDSVIKAFLFFQNTFWLQKKNDGANIGVLVVPAAALVFGDLKS